MRLGSPLWILLLFTTIAPLLLHSYGVWRSSQINLRATVTEENIVARCRTTAGCRRHSNSQLGMGMLRERAMGPVQCLWFYTAYKWNCRGNMPHRVWEESQEDAEDLRHDLNLEMVCFNVNVRRMQIFPLGSLPNNIFLFRMHIIWSL